MPHTVSYVCDKIEVFAFSTTEQAVDSIDYNLYDINILPLVETTDVICFSYSSFVEYNVDGTCMVFDIQPVAHIFSIAIDRQWLAVTDIVDEKWNQFFRKLIRTVVV